MSVVVENATECENEPITRTTADTGKYLSKKTIAQGMFDVALLSSNTNQLVQLLDNHIDPHIQPKASFRIVAITLLIISIILQIIVGGLLIFVSVTDKRKPGRKKVTRRLNAVSTFIIFIITLLNVLIPSFTPSTMK